MLIVTYSETDSVKFIGASIYGQWAYHIFVIENQGASEKQALEGNQTSSRTK